MFSKIVFGRTNPSTPMARKSSIQIEKDLSLGVGVGNPFVPLHGTTGAKIDKNVQDSAFDYSFSFPYTLCHYFSGTQAGLRYPALSKKKKKIEREAPLGPIPT